MELEAKLAQDRKRFWQDTETPQALDEVRAITGIRRLAELLEPNWKKRGEVHREDYRIEKIVLQREAGIDLPALLFVPNSPNGAKYLYLHADGKQADAAPGGPIEKLAQQGHIILAPDLCGIGETTPKGKHSYAAHFSPEWSEATIAYLIGTSLLAMRAEETLICGRFLAACESAAGPRQVHLISVGRVGPPALHAAALEPGSFATATLRNSLISWSNVVHTPLSINQFVNLVHGALKKYDLPDLVGTLPREAVEILEPLNGAEEPIDL